MCLHVLILKMVIFVSFFSGIIFCVIFWLNTCVHVRWVICEAVGWCRVSKWASCSSLEVPATLYQQCILFRRARAVATMHRHIRWERRRVGHSRCLAHQWCLAAVLVGVMISPLFKLHHMHAVHTMRPVATDVVCSIVCLSVCLSVRWSHWFTVQKWLMARDDKRNNVPSLTSSKYVSKVK